MKKLILVSALSCALLTGCWKSNEPWESLSDDEQELYFVNQFGASMMNSYYLWSKEIAEDIKSWHSDADPIAKTKQIRYKKADGTEVDKWTQMTDDYVGFRGQVNGNTTSTGLEYMMVAPDESGTLGMIVTYTYENSPARMAGLKRGDWVTALNDTPLTISNYQSLITENLDSGRLCKLTLRDGSTKSLLAREMYQNPVHIHKIIEKDGRKIGYLHYSSYTLKSIPDLIEVFKGFTAAGIDELVLDLRYNGGGYTVTSEVLASMIVPQRELSNSSVYQREIYNDKLTSAWGEEVTLFKTDFEYEDEEGKHTASTAGANPGISKLYVIMSYGTASASEATICGLNPYMDIQLIGGRSRGKYCGGIIVDGPTFYGWVKDDVGDKTYKTAVKLTNNWGIYVMISRYADKDGNTPCMPDGYTPDIEVSDNPLDGFELGDENETMLSVALNGLPGKARSSGSLGNRVVDASWHPEVRIITPRTLFEK